MFLSASSLERRIASFRAALSLDGGEIDRLVIDKSLIVWYK